MTGLHTGHAYIRGNGRHNLRPSDFTVAELFKQSGYTTGCFGKWGLGNEGTDGLPTRQGFDAFYGYLHQGHAHNFYPTFLINNERRVKLRNVPANELPSGAGWAKERVDYSHDLIVENALHWLDMNHKKPFFLYLPFTIPHANNEGTRGTGDGQDVPDYGFTPRKNGPIQTRAKPRWSPAWMPTSDASWRGSNNTISLKTRWSCLAPTTATTARAATIRNSSTPTAHCAA